MIPCAENCLHQCDGYCTLHGKTRVTNPYLNACPFYEKTNPLNKGNSLFNRFHVNKLDTFGNSRTH